MTTKNFGNLQTTLTLASNYPASCRAYLECMKVQPGMYFEKLSELESVFYGHGVAFIQLGVLNETSEAFNEQFGQWILNHRSGSNSSGWAVAIEVLAERNRIEPVELFFEFVEDFMKFWMQSVE